MGVFGTVVSFGAGYVAGMRIGDKPVMAARRGVDQMRSKASTITQQATQMKERAMGTIGGATDIDLREVRELMSSAPETVDVSATIVDAAGLMQREDIGNVIVTQAGNVAGIVTDRDIAVRCVAAGHDPATTKVTDAMTASPVTVRPTATVQEAIDTMRQNDVRRLPVVESGRPIGVVSLGDLTMSSQARSLLADISSAPPNN
jgi:CBS domain-containing protein